MSIVLGSIILALAGIDLIWTTVIPHGAGPLSSTIARGISSLIRVPSQAVKRWVQGFGGSANLLLTLSCWVALAWIGWWLVFLGLPQGVVSTATGEPAGTIDRLYFTGYNLSTLGLGDFKPNGWIAQLLTPLAAFWGLVTVTLSITYIIPVLSAVNEQRQLTAMIRDLGSTPASQVAGAWDGKSVERYLERINQSIVPRIHLHNQRHRTYPVIHYFRSASRDDNFAVMIAVLDETLGLIEEALDPNRRPDPWQVLPARRAIWGLLEQMDGSFMRVRTDTPPIGSLSVLEQAGIHLVDPSAYAQGVKRTADRRRRLATFVADAGWSWHHIESESQQ